MQALRARDWQRWDGFLPGIWERFELLQVFCEADAAEVRRLAPALAPRVRVNPYGMILPPPATRPASSPGPSSSPAPSPTCPTATPPAGWPPRSCPRSAPAARGRGCGSSAPPPPAEILDLAGDGIEVIADAPSMQPHLEAAAVVVAPVRSGGGMRMKVLEAMARRKAVVTTSLGAEGFASLEPEPPFLIADEAEGVADAIAGLLGDDDRRRELGARPATSPSATTARPPGQRGWRPSTRRHAPMPVDLSRPSS